ncbi:MAG: methyltransferase [Halioglobus sp.]
MALQPAALCTDSALSVLALRRNERANRRGATPVFWSNQAPPGAPALVVMRIPKQLAFFEYQLSRLAGWLAPGTTVLAAGMDKHLSANTAATLERFIGPTRRHPGARKARLFSAIRDDRPAPPPEPPPRVFCEALEAELESLPNVFSREKLDLGTRELIRQLHGLTRVDTLIDLACGNGVLGLVAYGQGLANTVVFCDESAMAIDSAQRNARRLFPRAGDHFMFHHGDGLLEYDANPAQIILCNPPFHHDHTVDEFAGRHLLAQCSRHMAPDGRLYVVANRSLNYLPVLRRTFRHVATVPGGAKFNLLLATGL